MLPPTRFQRRRSMLLFLVAALSSVVSGCAHRLAPGQESLRRHAIFVGSTGDAVDALTVAQARIEGRATDAPLDSVRYNIYVDSLIAAIEASGKDTVLLFVHGGRVGLQAGADRSFAMTTAIEASNYYPVFILWDASQWTSVGWHLWRYRFGRDFGKVWGPITAPLVLGTDFALGVLRAPWTLLHQTADYCRTSMRLFADNGRPSDASCYFTPTDWRERRKLRRVEDSTQADVVAQKFLSGAAIRTPTDSMQVSWGEYHLTRREDWYRRLTTAPLVPVKLAVGALVIDAFGVGAWDDMVRRTDAMFRPERELLSLGGTGVPRGRRPSGATGVLLTKLSAMFRADSLRQDSLNADGTTRRYKNLTLVGHSMGTIVVNRILREYPDLPVARVQYLAAAATLGDVESSVIPMLRRRPNATFEHATLHPYAESGEKQGKVLDLFVPRGSLLEWIDNHLEKSRSPFDRRAGKWRNVALALHIFPDSVRSRVTIKAFGVGDPQDDGTRFFRAPAKHGAFDELQLRFWCRDFWSIVNAGTGSPTEKMELTGADPTPASGQAGCPKETPRVRLAQTSK